MQLNFQSCFGARRRMMIVFSGFFLTTGCVCEMVSVL